MSRHVACSAAALLPLLLIIQTTTAYPYIRQRKADPFAALASTLRQQQEINPNYGYEEDYAIGNGRATTSEDDLWRLEELQRQLGRAAMLPFYGIRPQRSWGNLVTIDGTDLLEQQQQQQQQQPMITSGDLEGHVIRQAPVIEYGVPIDEVVDQGSIWYDDGPIVDGIAVQNQQELSAERERERQKQAENELLMNTLAEYMLLYDSEKSSLPVLEDKRDGSHRPENEVSTTEEPSMVTDDTSSSVVATTTRKSITDHKDQPPAVQIADDGTPMGQKEFPMMRPATSTQRKQWLTTTQGKLDFASSKRNHFRKSQNEIVTPEDRLTRELDNLKTKKN